MIDILPYKQKKVVRKIRYMRIATVVFTGGIILLIISVALFMPTLMTINNRYALANEQIKKLELSGTVLKKVDIAELLSKTDKLTKKLALNLPPSALEYIGVIKKYEKTNIKLIGFDFQERDIPRVEVRGVASTRQSLQDFISNIENDENVEMVDSPVSNFIKTSQGEFVITVTFKKK